MTHPAIETVIFDLGNVLVGIDDQQVSRRLSSLTGKSELELRQAFVASLDRMMAYERGELNVVEFYHVMLRLLGLDQDRYPYPAFRGNWCDVVVLREDMARLFHQCAHGRTTCILSNTNDLHWNHVASISDLLQTAHDTLTSYQCGLYKPQPEIYEAALEKFGVTDPAAAVFIDDRIENVTAACRVGMAASFQHVDEPSTRARLVDLGVLDR